MPYVDIHADFDLVAARERHKELSAQIPEGLGVNRSVHSWTKAWDKLIDQKPVDVYKTIALNLPDKVSAFVDFNDVATGAINICVHENKKCIFETQNKIMADVTGKTLRFEDWQVKEVTARHHGLGVGLFKNLLEFAEKSEFDRITLRAGMGDGKFFWARHGFYLKNDFSLKIMLENLSKNMKVYADILDAQTRQQVYEIIAEGSLDTCWKIARLNGDLQGKPIGWQLMKGDNPEYILNLHDDEQMVRAKQSLVRQQNAPAIALTHN